MRAAQTLDEMLPQILDETLEVMGTDAGIVRLYDAVSGELQQAVARGWFAQIKQTPLKPGEGIIGTVYATGKPIVTKEFATDSRIRAYMRPQIPVGWGGACVPIRTADAFIGILLIGVRLPRELSADEVHLLTTIADIAGNAIHRTRLHESLEGAYIETVLALAKAMDARDSYTGNHSEDLAKMSRAVAQALRLPRDQQEALLYAARLHDIGKIGVPDAVLRKPGSLAGDELRLMQQHPVIGAEIIHYVRRLRNVVPIVRHHHEKFDGTGYPDGLVGEAIPLGARILAIVDAFSAMTDDRVYRQGRSRADAIEEIKRCAGTQFDPRITEIFLTVVNEMK
jgi:putative nucleotidyltransferase with HDIG domain